MLVYRVFDRQGLAKQLTELTMDELHQVASWFEVRTSAPDPIGQERYQEQARIILSLRAQGAPI